MDPQWNRFLSQVRSGVIDIAHLVANVIDQDTRQWDIGKLSNLFEPATVNMILNIHLSDQLLHDQVFWCLSSSREFSLKSAYKAINSSNTQIHPLLQAKDWKELWKINANARLKNLLWKTSWNILNNRFPIPSLNFYLCNNASKSLEHCSFNVIGLHKSDWLPHCLQTWVICQIYLL